MSKIIDFYNLKLNDEGITLAELWVFSDEELEECHSYIQWMFPLTEPSQFHPEVPTLTQEDIEAFRENIILRYRLATSFEVMLDFYGLKQTVDAYGLHIVPADNYKERAKEWQTLGNHNYLRITRIITCLKLLGLKREAEAFYSFMYKLWLTKPGKVDTICLSYWLEAITASP